MRGKPELIQLRDIAGNLKSPFWYIKYYDGRSKRVSTGCRIGAQDHEANTALAAFTLERERPTARGPDQLMTAQVLRDYWDEHAQFVVDKKREEACRERLLPSLGPKFASNLTPAIISQYVRECESRGESNGTIRRDLEHLRAALNHEVKEQRLIYCPKIQLPSRPKARERILSIEEIGKMLNSNVSDHIRNTITLMLNTGQRPGVVSELTWFQVDFKERIINFSIPGKKQTNKRVRSVRMNAVVYELLKGLHKQRTTEFVIEQIFRNKSGDVTKTRPAGNIKKGIKSLFLKVGITEKGSGRYTLRHTFANLFEGEDKTRSDIMGHTDTTTTEWHYLKANKTKQQAALDGVGEIFKSAQKVRKRKRGKS